jgi:alginate O-acetyltransferase complex protein AlgI
MLFNSSEFLFPFLPLTLGVFLLLTRFSGARAAIAWLTLASLFFYSLSEVSRRTNSPSATIA